MHPLLSRVPSRSSLPGPDRWFVDDRLSPGLRSFLASAPLETPFLALDVQAVVARYAELRSLFPQAEICYAMKANPHPAVLRALLEQGSSIDVASGPELQACLELGAGPLQLSYGNTIKKAADIGRAFQAGVRTFAFDSAMELEKIAAHAPGSRVLCRLLTSGEHAGWPLSRKFGCDEATAQGLLARAPALGLVPMGLSFHVGSQQMNPLAWDEPVAVSARVFRALARRGVHLRALNLGGGFPARYRRPPPPLGIYAEAIHASLHRAFGVAPPLLMLEPGRSLVADAGVLEAEVVLVSRRSTHDPARWVYLDIGKFGGLAETMDECIRYDLTCTRAGETGPVVLAGPTCDSADILYERSRYELPLALEAGDRVRFHSAGAYTSTYASVSFNGFAPLRTYVVGSRP